MCGTAASVLYRNLGSDGWPRQYYRDQDICTLERYLIYEYAKMSLYEWQINLGMLSPYAELFYPGMEKTPCERDLTVTTENVKNELKENANHKINIKKEKENKLEKSE